MRVLVKVSGDLVGTYVFNTWLKELAEDPSIDAPVDLWVLSGAGTNISQALDEAKEPYTFGPGGREGLTSNGIRIAYHQLLLAQVKISAGHTIVPVWSQWSFMLNGDLLAQALYPNFDKVYIVATPGREKSFVARYDRMEIVYLGGPTDGRR